MKKSFIYLFISVLIIFTILISPLNIFCEQITFPFYSVQNNYENKSNTLKSNYYEYTTRDWLQGAISACKKNAPAYFKQYWNWLWWIKNSTNCYAYAFDMTKNPITGEYFEKNIGLQPGSLSGQKVRPDLYSGSPKSNQRLVDIISKDMDKLGFLFIEAKPQVMIPDGAYMVALSVFPGDLVYMSDYHWYRLNQDGTWSHKPGFNNVTNIDESGDIIEDPLTANRGNYINFVGYFYVVKNIEIK